MLVYLLEKVDIRASDRPRLTYVCAKLDPKYKQELVNLLKEYQDCFAWEYYEMPGLSRSIIEHRLPIKDGYQLFKQAPRRFKPELLEDIKKEITRLYEAKFI
jgi:superfamily II helicase